METYYSHCGRYSSTLDYVFLPNCLLDNILMAKTFDLEFDNTSDHVPIQLNVSYSNEQDNQMNKIIKVLIVTGLSRKCIGLVSHWKK